jgi:hypothetical protein
MKDPSSKTTDTVLVTATNLYPCRGFIACEAVVLKQFAPVVWGSRIE